MKKILVVVFVAMLALPVMSVAQKLGHINSQQLLSLMPESKAAEAKLKAKGTELEKQMKDLQTQYQKLFKEYADAMQAKSLTPDAQKSKEESLQAMQQKIQAYQVQAQKDVEKLQADLLSPIFEKANKAIQEVGKKNGFTYIFDTSARSIVYVASDSQDILPLVKKQLGI
ncbi:MAG: OmpH family outer membrane protein [Flavobacteriaceae bacterium]|nr:OmpH family outer membrane protein [Flavobacteriaceae bacterium]